MTAAEVATTSRRAQGLPERLTDPVALARLAALIQAEVRGVTADA